MKGVHYSLDEKIAVVEAYIRGGRKLRAAYDALPHRSDVGVRDMLVRLNVHQQKRAFPWTMEQERVLVRMWRAGAKAKTIGRTVKHSYQSVMQHVAQNRVRLGLKPRKAPPKIAPGQIKLIGLEMERALDRICSATGKGRGTVKRYSVRYLMLESRRVRAAMIVDIGGMTDRSKAHAA